MDVESQATIDEAVDRLQTVGAAAIDRAHAAGDELVDRLQAVGTALVDRAIAEASNVVNGAFTPALQELSAFRQELAAWRTMLGRISLQEPK